jgi:hypothetical protein
LRRLRPGRPTNAAGAGSYGNLVRRIEHLEAALEGLQDAVYRQDVIKDRQIAALQRERRP